MSWVAKIFSHAAGGGEIVGSSCLSEGGYLWHLLIIFGFIVGFLLSFGYMFIILSPAPLCFFVTNFSFYFSISSYLLVFYMFHCHSCSHSPH